MSTELPCGAKDGTCPCACHDAFTVYTCQHCACPDQAHRMKGWPTDE